MALAERDAALAKRNAALAEQDATMAAGRGVDDVNREGDQEIVGGEGGAGSSTCDQQTR